MNEEIESIRSSARTSILWMALAGLAGSLVSGSAEEAETGLTLISGERISVWTADGRNRGPLSGGLSNHPVGAIPVYGTNHDLFMAAGRFSSEPGLFLYRWTDYTDDGVPVFGERVRVHHPGGGGVPPEGTIFRATDGTIYGYWLIRNQLVRSIFHPQSLRFGVTGTSVSLAALPGGAERLTVLENPDGSHEIIFSVSAGGSYRPSGPGHRDPEYRPFDGAGIWRGEFPYQYLVAGRLATPGSEALEDIRRVSFTKQEVLLTSGNVTTVSLGPGRERSILTGSRFGNFLYYSNSEESGVELEARRLIVDDSGLAHRHPTIRPTPIAYPNRATGLSDLIAGGEGGLYYYRFSHVDARGTPVYEDPVPVLEERANLYIGSLPVVNIADWNGNGINDLIVGNSEGKVLFFRNRGTNEKPAMVPAEEVWAEGRPIHIQQGYSGVQGPGEARWGYVCPTVFDWTGNGLLDILMSSATQRHKVYRNIGDKSEPRLERARSIYRDGLDLHGTWRVQPGVARIDERIAYVALDNDDQFRLYWKLDDFNVEDGGKLRLTDGSPIGANFLSAGGTGRLKIVLADWDGDGHYDLLVGTPRHASVPDRERGLPRTLGLPGAAVLWLRNAGTNEDPVFEFPKVMHFRGEPRFFNQHACSPAIGDFGGPDGPHLLVGDEEGRIHFFDRRDVSWGN